MKRRLKPLPCEKMKGMPLFGAACCGALNPNAI